MASKRNLPILKTSTASPITHAVPQKPTSSPPSPPPATISLKDLQDALKANLMQFRVELKEELVTLKDEVIESMEEKMEKKNTQIREDIIDAFSGLALNIERIDHNMDEIKQDVAEMENRVEILENDSAIAQFHEMESAIRIRGLKEDPKEDLKVLVAKEIGLNMGWKADFIEFEIEKVFRVNSRVARQRNLPRDVVIYFSRKSMRNEIIQAFYKQRFQIAAQDVIILKEIPLKILRARKNFSFLSDELKRRQIQFRWEIPIGISLNYEGKRYRLITITKAKEFYYSILKASGSPSSQLQQQQQHQPQQSGLLEKIPEVGATWSGFAEQGGEEAQKVFSEIKEQRMTRAAYRRKEKEVQQKLSDKSDATVFTEPVGGARPKRSTTMDLQALLSRLQAGPDGQVPDLEC